MIKIVEEKRSEIQEALERVNGRARAHVFGEPGIVFDAAAEAERQLANLGIPIKSRIGAKYFLESGKNLPKSYGHSRKTTLLTLVRKSKDWYLESVKSSNRGCYASRPKIVLTFSQDAIAIACLRKKYSVTPK